MPPSVWDDSADSAQLCMAYILRIPSLPGAVLYSAASLPGLSRMKKLARAAKIPTDRSVPHTVTVTHCLHTQTQMPSSTERLPVK